MRRLTMSYRLLSMVPLLWLFGCGKDDAEPLPGLEVTPTSLTFGEVPVGATTSREASVQNVGSGAADVLSIALTDGDSDVWSISGSATTIEPGDFLVITVTFAPQEEQQEYGQVAIRVGGDDLVVQLSGIGAAFDGDGDGDGVNALDDCDDGDGAVYPGAPEICDGQDNDCDGEPGSDELDEDSDGHFVCDGDCDDTDAAVGPGEDHPETCDGRDEDCDGVIDDLDADGDGHSPCSFAGDCDDADPLAYPIYVDLASTAQSPDGTDGAPYSSLSDAITAVDSTCQEIAVAPGRYVVDAYLPPRRLAFRGAGSDATIFVPPAATAGLVIYEGDYSFSDLAFEDGAASDVGGALYVAESVLTVRRVRFENNTAAHSGGAIYMSRSLLAVSDSTFVGNTAGEIGGAIHMSGESDVAWEIARNTFVGNTAELGGGGIYVQEVSQPDSWIRNNLFQGNAGGTGAGGLHVEGSSVKLTIANNTFVGEISTSGDGGCVYLSSADGTGLHFGSNVMVGCGGVAGLFVDTDSETDATYNTVYGTLSGVDFSGMVTAGIDGQEASDPLFVSADDPTPASGSPLLDSGVPDASWNDADGSRNDRGFTGGPSAP